MFRKFFMAFSIFFAITSFAQTYFVEIPTSGPDTMRFLNSAKFDVAGIDRMRGMIGVVASPDDLERLSALGLRYDVIDSSPVEGLPRRSSFRLQGPAGDNGLGG